MISSCKDCQTKCCSVGPGPYELIEAEQFLLNYGENDNYNKKCIAFMHGKCTYWGKSRMPLDCKIYVCQVRSFSKLELNTIAALTGRE